MRHYDTSCGPMSCIPCNEKGWRTRIRHQTPIILLSCNGVEISLVKLYAITKVTTVLYHAIANPWLGSFINHRRACARVTVLVNPRRACARVTVLVLSVCLSVCLCVFPILAPRAIRRTNSSISDFSAIRA